MSRAAAGIEPLWQSFIGGRWVEARRRLPVEDPGTGETVAEVALADADDVDTAVRAAARCHRARALTAPRPERRLELMLRIAAEIRALTDRGADLLCRESGKALDDARHEFEEAARYFEYYGGMADKIEGRSIPLGDGYVDWTVREPLGVSAQVVPWNFPVALAARSLAAALATGNAVVIKTPELAPLAATLLGVACERAGAPEGAVNILTGYGDEAGAALVAHPQVNQIVFTGSVPTGRSILHAAAERVVPCVMELGGKSAGIVFDDAELDTVLASIRSGIFFNAGQVCSALARVLVHESVHDELVERAVALAEGLRVGHGLENPDLTPLISAAQRERVERLCRAGVDAGATAATGGQRIDRPGHFMQPTVFTGVRPDMEIAREEIFGPALALMKFRTAEEAIELANGTDYGLVAGVFTRDLDRALHTSRQLVAGQVYVNEWFAGGVETPFGGMQRSGYGREKGLEALDNYLQTKNIAVRIGEA
ncbi:MAG: aldehyde dehydrogenase family protein [Halofilum sp. (in: g-proteobacteria)]|nr:aldehyde dehydrogenase family protein [Halofilum sp. (in: g-proteobacteria)]